MIEWSLSFLILAIIIYLRLQKLKAVVDEDIGGAITMGLEAHAETACPAVEGEVAAVRDHTVEDLQITSMLRMSTNPHKDVTSFTSVDVNYEHLKFCSCSYYRLTSSYHLK